MFRPINKENNHFSEGKSFILALFLWCLFGVVIIFFVLAQPGKRVVTPVYWEASLDWIKGNNIYAKLNHFLYFPHSAILQIPFAVLPFTLAEVLWRILNIAFYAFSCYLISSLLLFKQKAFLIISAFAIPLAYSSARYGQLNLLVASFLGIVAFLLAHKKYTQSIIICLLGFAFKPYMAVPLLLICCLFPKQCLLPTFLGLIILFLFPYFFQNSGYVWYQYQECMKTLNISMRIGQEFDFAYLFGMLKSFGVYISAFWQISVTLGFAFIIFLYSVYLSKKNPMKENSIIIVTLATIFILLFSSRTENNTYCLISSFFAYFFLYFFH